MMLFPQIKTECLRAVAATLLALSMSLPALAIPARIVGAIPGSQVNIRTQPSANAPSPSYGLVGDRVEVLRDTVGTDGLRWYYVRFPQSGAEGWIRGDLVELQATQPQIPSRWSHVYACGPYTITLAETENGQYSYRSRSSQGNLDLFNGVRRNSGYSWNYEFINSTTTYVIEDAWSSDSFPGGFAELRVFQSGQPILRQVCQK